MGQDDHPDGKFHCHPECLKWPLSYWRQLLLQVEEESRGMSPGRLGDLMLRVREAEAKARWPDYEAPQGWWPDHPATRIGRQGVVELHLHAFAADQIDLIFGFPDGTAATVLASAEIHPKAQEIIAAHLEGHPPSRISRDLKVGIPTVIDQIERIGETPHRLRDLTKSEKQNRTIITLYEELRRHNNPNIYKEIARRVGIDEKTVKQRLQYARKKGRITDPPLQGGRRRPRAAE